MSEGTVKWFNPKKGYGFIATPDGKDIFVHYASITGEGYKTLVEGDPVTFDIVEGEKGLRAEKVVQQAAAKSEVASESEAAAESEAATESEVAAESEAVSQDKEDS